MKRSIRALVVTLVLNGLFSCTNLENDMASIQEEVATLNSECPKMIDNETRLERVEFQQPDRIAYYYSLVHVYRQNVDTQLFRQQLWPGLLSIVCTSPDMEKLRANSIKFEYVYLDQTKQKIYTFNLGPEQYKR